MRKILLTILTLALALNLGACDFFGGQDGSESEQALEELQKMALAQEAARQGKALAAGFAGLFEVSADEKKILEAGPAVNALGTVNGFFTNPQGISGYFQSYEKPFNFIWTGRTEKIKAFDGRTYQAMSGPGVMILKYMNEDQLLQRYEGESSRGLLQGYGEQWSRNNSSQGHHYYSYRGELKHDQMDGRGAVADYDFLDQDSPPIRYEGELRNNLFHGHGRAFDLSTGMMLRKGLWLGGQPFDGTEEQWRRAEEEYDREYGQVQYRDVLMTDALTLEGFVLADLEELMIFPPPGAEKVRAFDQAGRQYSFAVQAHPMRGDDEGEHLQVLGCREKRPLSDYPLNIEMSYQRHGKQHFLRFTALRPFGLDIESEGPGVWDEPPK